MQNIIKRYLLPYLWITVGSAAYAVGFNWCYVPNQISFGGITGVGQIINHLLPWVPIGGVVILLNVPLFLLGWKLLGGHLLVSSLYAMFVSSVMIDALTAFHTFQPMEPMLACIFGGLFMGGSLGIIFLQGATTGGTDLIARLLKLKMSWLPMGKLLMGIDLVVIVAVAAVFRSFQSALYGLVALYISSIVMDGVLYGMDMAKVAYIISDKPREITEVIIHDIDRGVTILHGEGGYSGAEKQVLMVAIKQKQIVALKEVVGRNKLAPDYDAALWRARNIASPKNAQRLGRKTPCAVKADKCYDCKSPERICRALTVLWERPKGIDRAEVVLIDEDLGY